MTTIPQQMSVMEISMPGGPQVLKTARSTLRSRPDRFKTEVAKQLKEQVWPKIETGTIKPKVDKNFALAQAADAHRLMESAQHFGKIILRP